MNNKVPAISILVPIYKAEKYLQKCIDSILNQTFSDFEIVLVDDGSPDRSGAICDDYAIRDNRIRVIHKENGGVASARQAGLATALGTYIIHIDPDDWIEKDMLKDMYELALQEDSDVVIADYYIDYGTRVRLHENRFSNLHYQEVLNQMILHSSTFMWNKLVKASCYYSPKVIKWENGVNHFEDLIFCVNLFQSFRKISYLPKAFYHYTQNVNPHALIQGTRKFYELRLIANERVIPLLEAPFYKEAKSYLKKLEAYAALKELVFNKREFMEKYGELKNISNKWYGEKHLMLALNGHYYLMYYYLFFDERTRTFAKRLIFAITNFKLFK